MRSSFYIYIAASLIGLGCFVAQSLAASELVQEHKKESEFGVYGGYEFMNRTLKLATNTAAGTLSGLRFGVSMMFPHTENFSTKISLSSGYSTGLNSKNSSSFQEKFSSFDVKPTFSVQYSRYSLGIAVRYEIFTVDTVLPTSQYSNKYKGIEIGPSIQVVLFRLFNTLDLTLGAEYLTGKMSSLESSQLGAKLQLGMNF